MVLIKQDLKDIIQKAEYIEGTHGTTATPTWTGTSTKITSLQKGQVIYYKMTSAGTSAGDTLNLTLADGKTTGAKQIYYHGTTTKLTTHFPVNTVLQLVYDGTSWRCTAIQDTNNYDRLVNASQFIVGEKVNKYTLIGGASDNKYYLLKANLILDTTYPILWLGADYNSGATATNLYNSYASVNIQNTISGKTLIANEQAYVEGVYYSNNQFKISSNILVSDSNIVDGRYYIPIGNMTSTTNLRFNALNRNIYYCKDGELYTVNDNLSINGGRNLIPNSQEFTGISTGTLTGETYKDCAIRRYNNTTGTNYMDCTWDLPTIRTFYPGDEYTLSFWAKGTGDIDCYSYGASGYIGTNPIKFSDGGVSTSTSYGDGRTHFTLSNEWKRYYVTWKLNPSSNASSNTILKKLLIRTLAGTDAYYCGVMFEEGSVPHDWSPNPNDYSKQNHTHHDTDIDWEGINTQNSVSPLDMAMYEEFSANRLAFFDGDNITVEYSTDGGTTWTKDTSITASNKSKITSTVGQLKCGNGSTTDYSKNQLRITFDMGDVGSASILYMTTRKLMIYYATAGALNCKVQISTSTYANPTTFTNIGSAYGLQGWSGWNSIPLNITLGGTASQTGNTSVRVKCLRLTFTQTGGTGNGYVNKVKLFGESQWNVPSNLARNGHIYNYNEIQDVVFPAKVTASSFVKSGGTSSQFLKADGSVDSSTYLKSVTAHTNATASNVGQATNSVFGHTKLSDNYTSSGGSASQGISASSKAVYDAYTTLNNKINNLQDIGFSVEVCDFPVSDLINAEGDTSGASFYDYQTNIQGVTLRNGVIYLVEDDDTGLGEYYEYIFIPANNVIGTPETCEKLGTIGLENINLNNYIQKANNTNLLLANGSTKAQSDFATSGHSHSYGDITNKPSYTATVTSSTSGAYKIGSINISGSNVDIYGKDTNTTYTPASASPLRLHGNAGVVGTSAKYAREDHRHPRYVKYEESNTAPGGYFKLFRVTVGSWCNKPFVFKIIRRGATQEINYKLRFSNVDVSTTIPTVTSLYNTGDEFNLWVYNNQDKTFDIIVKEPETYFSCDVEFYDGMNLAVTDLQTRLTATEFNNLTASNLTKSTYTGFTSAEKTKLSGIATGANKTTIVNDLTTGGTGSALSAEQGKTLNTALNGKVAVSQGTGNSGKFLKVNTSGNVACESVTIPSAYTHPNSGVTAGTNYNGNQTPSFGGTFNIPKLTFNAQGHITASANSTVKIPALPTSSTSQAGIIQIGTGASNAAAGNHTHSGYASSTHTHGADQVFHNLASNYSIANLGFTATTGGIPQSQVNDAINTKIGELLENKILIAKVFSDTTPSIASENATNRTFNVPKLPDEYSWVFIPTKCNYGNISSSSLDTDTNILTVRVVNLASSSHGVTYAGILVYYHNSLKL